MSDAKENFLQTLFQMATIPYGMSTQLGDAMQTLATMTGWKPVFNELNMYLRCENDPSTHCYAPHICNSSVTCARAQRILQLAYSTWLKEMSAQTLFYGSGVQAFLTAQKTYAEMISQFIQKYGDPTTQQHSERST